VETKPILYAEDEENDAFFMQRAFRQAGISTPLVIAANGQEAVDYVFGAGRFADRTAHPSPCLVLLDLNMPRLSGIEVLKQIRMTPTTAALPVVVITSSAHDSDIHRAYVQGANGYLVKPSKPDELLAMVKAIKDYWLIHNRAADDNLKAFAASF